MSGCRLLDGNSDGVRSRQEVVCWDLVLSFDGSHEEERVSELLPHHDSKSTNVSHPLTHFTSSQPTQLKNNFKFLIPVIYILFER